MNLAPVVRTVALAGLVLVMSSGSAEAGEIEDLTGLEKANIRTMEVATACWFLAIGCSVGSFLNVVAYRLPAGMRLGKPKSHCPHCKTPLGRYENLPVLGWLLLRGRCRHCSAPISPRYPLVEAAVGGVFVALLFAELLSGGANLPFRRPNSFAGVVWIIWYTKWDLVGLYLFHSCLLCITTVIALIAIDRKPLPRSLVLWSVGVGVLFPTIWPTLHPVPSIVPRPDWLAAYAWRLEWTDPIFSAGWKQSIGISLAGFLDSAIGLAGGLLCGLAVGLVERAPRTRRTVHATFAIAGTFLGWQAAISLATLATLVVPLRLAVPRIGRTVPSPVVIAVLTLGQILAWRWLFSLDFWPSYRGLPALGWPIDPAPQLLGLLLLLAATNLGVGRLVPPDDLDSPHDPAQPPDDEGSPPGETADPASTSPPSSE